jgi:hypothetical protein
MPRMLATIFIGRPSQIPSGFPSPTHSHRLFHLPSFTSRLLACVLALFLICTTTTAFAVRSAPALLAEAEDAPPPNSGWWESVSAKKWEFSFLPGDTRYGFRIPIYPALACIVLIVSCSSLLDNAQRQKKSGVGPGIAMGAGVFLFLALLWQSAFREPKLRQLPTWNTANTLQSRPLIPTLPPSESLLRNPQLVHPSSRTSDLLKNAPPASSPPDK